MAVRLMMKRMIQYDYVRVVLLCLLTSSAMFLPSIIKNGGLFAFIGDFNVQQIPFNILSNRAIKSGDLFWNWSTDLGSNFIGSYSFYTLGSPFFWFSLLFPPEAFPYLIGPLLMLKYCVAGLTSFAYIQRYVTDKNYAIAGALLYAFSGFSTINLMFNHFHDVIALFPLLLIAMDRLVEDKKPGWFAAAVALNATLNFFFFIGEAVFLVLYYCVRFLMEDFRKYIRMLFRVAAEATLGVGMACFLFYPAIVFTMDNPRIDAFLYGPSALAFYGSRYLELIKGLLMPAEIMPYQSAIYEQDFTSSNAWLPLFGPALAIAALFAAGSWVKRLLLCCLVMAFVPILNNLFYALTGAYYARWFYMPVLIMALASAVVLEKRRRADIKKGLWITTAATALLALYLLFYPWSEDRRSGIFHLDLFLMYLSFSALGLLTAAFTLFRVKKEQVRLRILTGLIIVFAGTTGLFHITAGHVVYDHENAQTIYDSVVKTGFNLNRYLPDEENYRIRLSDDGWNLAMVSGTPTVNSFTSMVNGSIFEFYESIGSSREVKTVIPEDDDALGPLLSQRFYVSKEKKGRQPVYAQFDNGTETIYIYEYERTLPIGFTYDYYITDKEFRQIPIEDRHRVLLKAVVLSEEEAKKVRPALLPLPAAQYAELGDRLSTDRDVRARSREASTSFQRDVRGFTAKLEANSGKYAFFSVPYDQGWHASVNGRRVSVVNADGFMIVPVEEGENTIRFDYETPGLKMGLVMSFASLIGYVGYLYIGRKTGWMKRFSEKTIVPGR